MMQSRVSLREVDESIGGQSLNPGLVSSFEAAYAEFRQVAEHQGQESEQRLTEVVRLLEVSESNLEELRGQGWFKRAWRTVTGKNRNLARANEQNLLMVQKGAVYFLQRLAENNEVLMRSVHQALIRVEDLQIDNLRLKGYLVRLGRKFAERISDLEMRVATVETTLQEGGMQNRLGTAAVVVANVLIVVAVFLLLALDSDAAWVRGTAIGMLVAAFVCFGAAFWLRNATRRGSGSVGNHALQKNPAAVGSGRLARENRRLQRKVQSLLGQGLMNRAEESGEPILMPILGRLVALNEALGERDEDEEFDAEERVAILETMIETDYNVEQEMAGACAEAGRKCRDNLEEVATGIAESYLDNTEMFDLQVQEELPDARDLERKLLSALRPLLSQTKAVEKGMEELRVNFPRYRDLVTESDLFSFGKAFVKGILIIPAIVDDEEEFLSDFQTHIGVALERIERLQEIVVEETEDLLRSTFESYIVAGVGAMTPMLEAFTDQEISLAALRDDLELAMDS